MWHWPSEQAAGNKETDRESWDTRDALDRTVIYDAWEGRLCAY